MNKWNLIIPSILIIGSFVLIALGIDGEVKAILAMGAAWAFKTAIDTKKKNGG